MRDRDPKLIEFSQRIKAAIVCNDFDTYARLLSQEIYTSMQFFLAVKIEDQDAFERDFFRLKPYYTDARGRLPPAAQEYSILGLNLLRLLVQNRIAEFHTLLESLSPNALDNPCIQHAVELEQSFMEGAYHRVLSARQSVPDATYTHFMDLLAKTVRTSGVENRCDFPESKEIPSLQLITQTLSYARELERIV